MLPNPVAGYIHPASWVRPSGNTEFEVTSPFGPRVIVVNGERRSAPHSGLDIGNGRAGANVMSQITGRVVECRPTVDGVVTVQSPNGLVRFVAAHMTGITVRLGSAVAVGQVLGKVGNVGVSTAAHLHFQNGKLIAGRWVWEDPWPLLDQNGGEGDDVNLKGTPIEPLNNRQTNVLTPTGLGLVEDPTAQPYKNLTVLPVGTAFTPDWIVKGNALLGSDRWYGGWVVLKPPQFGYLPVGGCGPLVKSESGGFTQDDLNDSYNAGRSAVQAAAAGVPPK